MTGQKEGVIEFRDQDEFTPPCSYPGWHANIGPAKRELDCECPPRNCDPHPLGHCRTCGRRLDHRGRKV